MARVQNKLRRQINRHLTEGDFLQEILAIREKLLAQGPLSGTEQSILSGFEEFFASIENTYNQYEDKNKMALRNLEISSGELNAANHALESLNASMRAMLESLGPALLFFGKDGICAPVFSKSCETILESAPGGRPVGEVLKLGAEEHKSLQSLIAFAFNNKSALSFGDIFKMAPQRFANARGRVVSLDYRPIAHHDGSLSSILVIATDRTEETSIRALVEEQERYATKILRLAQNRNSFMNVLDQIRGYFLGPHPRFRDTEDLTAMKNELHTLKGLAGSFYMEELVDIVHGFEDAIVRDGTALEDAVRHIERHIQPAAVAIEATDAFVRSLFGYNEIAQGGARSIKLGELTAFHDTLKNADPGLAETFRQLFLTVPVSEALKVLDQYVDQAAIKLGKEINPCRFEGTDFQVPVGLYDPLFSSFVHIIRNGADHGIEHAAARTAAGKPPAGTFVVRTERLTRAQTPWARITIEDDGRGIDVARIKKKIESAGVDTAGMSEQEIVQHILLPDVSSAPAMSSISGRGIGLSAVRNEAEKLNGSLRIEQEPGRRTAFIVEWPLTGA